jgi:hypothetical protein
MYYDFYAAPEDTKMIFDFIFSELQLEAYLSYSDAGQPMKSYNSTDEVFKDFSFVNSVGNSINFQLWSPNLGGDLVIEKINLDPKRCNGHVFRYATRGWGLIQFYCGVLNNNKLTFSHLGHHSLKKAMLWQDTNKGIGSVEKWNWKEVEISGKKLKYFIQKKLGVTRIEAYDTLINALTYVERK